MNSSNTEIAELSLRELTADETEAVSGSFLPLAIMAFAIGFDAGFRSGNFPADVGTTTGGRTHAWLRARPALGPGT